MSADAASPLSQAAGNLVVDLGLSLSYRHGFGDLSPFFKALLEGRALASRCPACGDVRYPPRLVCPRDGTATQWQALSGEGSLTAFTIGRCRLPLGQDERDHIFGEVAMDGASNRVFARIAAAAEQLQPGVRVRLAPPVAPSLAPPPPHPIQALVFIPI